MLVATLGPSAEGAGKTISYENGRFTLEGFGAITPRAILDLDREEQLVWATQGSRAWVQSLIAAPVPVPVAPATPAKGLSSGVRLALVLGVVLVVAIVAGALLLGSDDGTTTPAVSSSDLHQSLSQQLRVKVDSCRVSDGEAEIALEDSGPSQPSDYLAAAERDCFDAFRIAFAPGTGLSAATVEVRVERSDQFGYTVWDPVYKATLRADDAAGVAWETATPQDVRDLWSVDFSKDYMTP